MHYGSAWGDRFRSLAFLIMLTPISEGTSRKVDTRDGSSDDRRAEPEGLCAEFVHEFGAEDTSREARETQSRGSREGEDDPFEGGSGDQGCW